LLGHRRPGNTPSARPRTTLFGRRRHARRDLAAPRRLPRPARLRVRRLQSPDADLSPSGKSVGSTGTLDCLSNWTGLTDEEYREKKAFVERVLLARLGNSGDHVPRIPYLQ